MPETDVKLRANVAAILRNPLGEILICERLGVPGAWQFPQGGVERGETPEQAIGRELWEEIGVLERDFHLVERRGPYRYLFGDGKKKKGYHGKEQLYFLANFVGPASRIDLATAHPEFQAFRWIQPAEFRIRWLPEMKREVYRDVFREFFSIKL